MAKRFVFNKFGPPYGTYKPRKVPKQTAAPDLIADLVNRFVYNQDGPPYSKSKPKQTAAPVPPQQWSADDAVDVPRRDNQHVRSGDIVGAGRQEGQAGGPRIVSEHAGGIGASGHLGGADRSDKAAQQPSGSGNGARDGDEEVQRSQGRGESRQERVNAAVEKNGKRQPAPNASRGKISEDGNGKQRLSATAAGRGGLGGAGGSHGGDSSDRRKESLKRSGPDDNRSRKRAKKAEDRSGESERADHHADLQDNRQLVTSGDAEEDNVVIFAKDELQEGSPLFLGIQAAVEARLLEQGTHSVVANLTATLLATRLAECQGRNELQKEYRGCADQTADHADVVSFIDWVLNCAKKLRAEGLRPKVDRAQEAKDLGLQFPGDDRGYWNFGGVVGEGGFGIVGLWLKYDAHSRIIDRMVAKETYMDSQAWNDPRTWWKPQEEAREAKLHEILSVACGELRSIVKHHAHRTYADLRMHRVYMEYCDGGNLMELALRHNSRRGDMDEAGNELPFVVPAEAIWAFFEALAVAACLMAHGSRPDRAASPQWLGEIVHRDIKPYNIFLARNRTDRKAWTNIPEAKLGDFGCAIHTSFDEQFENPMDLVGMGTPGYMAPEQMVYPSNEELIGLHRISSAADVYAIGKSILTVMSLYDGPQEQAFGYDVDSGVVDIPQWLLDRYPNNLMGLVRRCLKPEPHRRITASDLLKEITQEVQRYEDDYDSTPMKFAGLDNPNLLFMEPDMYSLFAKG